MALSPSCARSALLGCIVINVRGCEHTWFYKGASSVFLVVEKLGVSGMDLLNSSCEDSLFFDVWDYFSIG